MKNNLSALIFVLLAAGCSAAPVDKTPQTQNGKLYSCMLERFHELKADGTLTQTSDDWALAGEIQQQCIRRLDMPADNFNTLQGMNVGVSMIRSMR